MDTTSQYREMIKQIIRRHAGYDLRLDDLRVETIFDEANDHYALVEAGWQNERRIEGQVIHVDIIKGKLWIQFDGTEYGVARELEDLGVPRSDIVLAFHSPEKRPYTGYAVA